MDEKSYWSTNSSTDTSCSTPMLTPSPTFAENIISPPPSEELQTPQEYYNSFSTLFN